MRDTKIQTITLYDQKRQWLIDNGYISVRDGVELITLEATAQLAGNVVSVEELKSYCDAFGYIPSSVLDTMREGAAFCKDLYGSNDMVEILYEAFAGTGVDAR